MLKRVLYALFFAILASVSGVVGFFLHDTFSPPTHTEYEYHLLKNENEDLRALVSEAQLLAKIRGGVVNSCMKSLDSCSKFIDSVTPQIRDGLQQPETSKRPQLANSEGRSGSTQKGLETGMGPGWKGWFKTQGKDACESR